MRDGAKVINPISKATLEELKENEVSRFIIAEFASLAMQYELSKDMSYESARKATQRSTQMKWKILELYAGSEVEMKVPSKGFIQSLGVTIKD